ncbi:hypothetical protein LEP1GSC034_0486 [Leptospira interrogans str. 2003000735]|uniref:Uncharacterized protein n=8 Tax=Leptospira interrogans TaxID=173 RepID=M7A3V3_LEPIR|nr:hypothetical protein LEP1GSC007_0661 [Leptospira interrogans serovar Bulgarica str. Mallika]EJP16243.1 hypothetical protein LEP1GSC080_2893 [Leptospira interrogans str. FPW2026]EKN86429.1 hypothetical protein LEP1GSC027_0047 [Leptospira interrogans str. 2002000624]EKP24243.1 hypothetical protein LEP1GSC117_1665 [Leptospira interrogans serovar Icterohaemorrhagiae str. Verdun LP]EKP75382.1 hypothetical protein LEP1GSC173_2954 [Leptospira interrogans str. HAI1594]EKQ37226.1 hypothetical protei
MNHSQIFVNPFRSKEFEKCVKKERVQKTISEKKKRSIRIFGFYPK